MHEIWDLIIQFEILLLKVSLNENNILETFRVILCLNSCCSDEKQIIYIRSLYIKRLSVPHIRNLILSFILVDIDDTFSAYSTFETRFDNQNYMKNIKLGNSVYVKAKTDLDALERWELKLVPEEWATFIAFIEHEMASKRPEVFRIRTLFERALIHHYYSPFVWDEYLCFLVLIYN